MKFPFVHNEILPLFAVSMLFYFFGNVIPYDN